MKMVSTDEVLKSLILKRSNEMKGQLYIVLNREYQRYHFKSIDILNSVDLVYAEDTRVTKVLFSHYDIKHKFIVIICLMKPMFQSKL